MLESPAKASPGAVIVPSTYRCARGAVYLYPSKESHIFQPHQAGEMVTGVSVPRVHRYRVIEYKLTARRIASAFESNSQIEGEGSGAGEYLPQV